HHGRLRPCCPAEKYSDRPALPRGGAVARWGGRAGHAGSALPTTLSRMSSQQGPSAETDAELARPGSATTFAALGVLAGAITAVVAALVVGLSAPEALTLLGIPDPGPLTTYGMPAVRALSDLFAALTVGSLLFAAFLIPPQSSGLLDVGGYRARSEERRVGKGGTVRGATEDVADERGI